MHGNRKYPLNELFFETIDSEEKAYWLGFIMADGYNNIKKRYVNVRLALVDEPHLKKLAGSLKTQKPLRRVVSSAYKSDKYESCQLAIDSVHISKQLEALGVDGNKSTSLKFPRTLDQSWYSHFLRGYFDGDGSVSWNNKLKKATLSICSTTEFCQSIRDYFQSQFGIGGSIIHNKKKPNSCAELHICGNQQILFLLTWMYDCCSICLDRKLEKYNEIMEMIVGLRFRPAHNPKKYEHELVKRQHDLRNPSRKSMLRVGK